MQNKIAPVLSKTKVQSTIPVIIGLVTITIYRYRCKPYKKITLLVWLQVKAVPVPYACITDYAGAYVSQISFDGGHHGLSAKCYFD
jgi:hypothetical protein